MIYVERMEFCVGYYWDVIDVYFDICYIINDDRYWSKIWNNIYLDIYVLRFEMLLLYCCVF